MNHSVNPNYWHENIRKARKARRVTQRDIALRTSIRQSRISQIENGQVDPKLSEIVAISEVLGLCLVQIPDYVLPSVKDATRDYERRTDDTRARTIPELILGDRAYS